jgi:hypothetical protein
MLWLPTISVLVEKAAAPFDSVPVPSWVGGVDVSSRKVTVPVGVPTAGAAAETVAEKVTGWPSGDGLLEDVSTTAAPPWLTTWARTVEVALAKLESSE